MRIARRPTFVEHEHYQTEPLENLKTVEQAVRVVAEPPPKRR